MKKTIAIDIDEVLADLITPWIKRYNLDFDDDIREEQIISWDISNFVKKEAVDYIYNYCADPKIYDFVKPIIGANLAITNLSKRFDIVYVTSSVYSVSGIKKTWLKNNRFPHSDNYVETMRKQYVDADIIIDDRFSNIYDFVFRKPSRTGILYAKSWNKDANLESSNSILRLDDWDSIERCLLSY